jgi:hypothetical protein
MEYEPEGFLEKAGDALGVPSSQVEEDLQRFRNFIEQRETETGSWRGKIENGQSVHSRAEFSQAGGTLDVKNGQRAPEIESREAPPLGTERAVPPSTGERGLEEMPAAGNLPLRADESGSESLDETAPLVEYPTSVEENSQFYRGASVLTPTYEQIAKRAYELYVARGRNEGWAREDWLEAEKQLSEEMRNRRSRTMADG